VLPDLQVAVSLIARCSVMKAIDLNSIPYKNRFNAASLLISKANRLGGLGLEPPDQKGDNQRLLAFDSGELEVQYINGIRPV
jgi:hypothetical protein